MNIIEVRRGNCHNCSDCSVNDPSFNINGLTADESAKRFLVAHMSGLLKKKNDREYWWHDNIYTIEFSNSIIIRDTTQLQWKVVLCKDKTGSYYYREIIECCSETNIFDYHNDGGVINTTYELNSNSTAMEIVFCNG